MKSLLESMKTDLTSLPVLARYDSTLSTLLKTGWSVLGMGFIIMQPDTSETTGITLERIMIIDENTFDTSLKGSRLRSILFGSRNYTEIESHYLSFVDEVAKGRWDISENRVYFWESHFNWLCDVKTIYNFFHYDGPIHTLRR